MIITVISLDKKYNCPMGNYTTGNYTTGNYTTGNQIGQLYHVIILYYS